MDIYGEIDNFLEDLDVTGPKLTFKECRHLLGELRRHLESRFKFLASQKIKFDFEDYRLAILIYLAQNYLRETHRILWYNYHRIHLVTKQIGHKKLNLLINDEVNEAIDDNDSVLMNVDYQIEESDEEISTESFEAISTEMSKTTVANTSIISAISASHVVYSTDVAVVSTNSVESHVVAEDSSDSSDTSVSRSSDSEISNSDEILPEKIIVVELPDHRHGHQKQTQMIFDEDYEFYQSVHRLPDEVIEEIYQKNFASDLVTDLKYDRRFIVERLNFYNSIPQAAQKSEEWLKQRTSCITASALADALGKKGKHARQNLLLNKISGGEYRTFFGNFYTHWGEKYESMAAAIYCKRLGVDLYDFGMLPHPKYKMLGASTDGITSQLINLEIKCPPTRQITSIIPKHYWIQIQLQLEVLNLPLSHFLECRIEEFGSAEDFYASFDKGSEIETTRSNNATVKSEKGSVNSERGIVVEVWDERRKTQGLPAQVYRYSPIDLDPDGYREWHQAEVKAILAEGLIWLSDSYWYLDVYSCINVQRDFKWFQAHLDQIFEFWKEVEVGREKGFAAVLSEFEQNRLPKSNSKIESVCLLDSDSEADKPKTKTKAKINGKTSKKTNTIMNKNTIKNTPKEVERSKPESDSKSSRKRSVIHFDLV